MIEAIILDDGYHSKDVVVKFGKNYVRVSLSYFLNSLCRRHDSDYEVKTAFLEDIASVARGRWIHLGGDEWCCSACGFVISTEGSWEKPTKKYCEDCGAKMEGELI